MIARTVFTAAIFESGSPPPDLLLRPGEQVQDLTRQVLASPALLTAAVGGVLAVLVGGVLAGGVLHRWRHRRLLTHAHEVTITPPPEVEPSGAMSWWANMGGLLSTSRRRRLLYGGVHVGLEYRWAGRQMQIVVWVPGTVPAGPVAAAARAAWPGASTTIRPATTPILLPLPISDSPPRAEKGEQPQSGRPVGAPRVGQPGAWTRQAGGALVPTMASWYPLATEHDTDPLRALISVGAGLHATEQACVQILARPATARQISRLRAGATALKSAHPTGAGPERALRAVLDTMTDLITDLLSPTRARSTRIGAGSRPGGARVDPLRERDARTGLDKSLGPQWEIAVRYGVTHTTSRPSRAQTPQGQNTLEHRLSMLAHQFAAAFAIHTARNHLRPMRVIAPARLLGARSLRHGFILSAPELAALAGLPTDLSVAGLDRARSRAVPAPIAVPAGGRGMKVLGRAEVGTHSVALPVVDARQHLHILGSTGVGKSTLMTHLILDDIRARRGVVLIDPKGDLALDVLDRIPLDAAERLVVIDPDQTTGSATFNPLEWRPTLGADPDVIVDNIVSIFANIFQRHWGPRIDDVLRVSCLTLMRHSGPTLINVVPLLNNKQFRAPLTVDLDDPAGLKGFWEWFESTPASLRSQVIGPVLARLRSFLLRDFVRAMLGPAQSSFDMSRVLDGGILIARLPKGQLGEDAARLLGSFVLASVWQAATARARLPEEQRRDASVYVDEAHGVLNLSGSVADMLAEARAYHLSLILAHQDLAQLPRETQMALSANARNKIFFNCSPEDARQLARHTLPELDEHDLAHLDAYTAVARLMIANRETAAFTLRTNPPRPTTTDRATIREIVARQTPTPRARPTSTPPPAPAITGAGGETPGLDDGNTPAPPTSASPAPALGRDDGHNGSSSRPNANSRAQGSRTAWEAAREPHAGPPQVADPEHGSRRSQERPAGTSAQARPGRGEEPGA